MYTLHLLLYHSSEEWLAWNTLKILSNAEIYKSIGRHIKDRRRSRGMSQTELATKISLSCGRPVAQTTLSAWERGKAHVPLSVLPCIADVLRCSVADFMPAQGCEPNLYLGLLTADEQAIISYLLSGSDESCHALIRFTGLLTALPSDSRLYVVYEGIYQYRQAVKNGTLRPGVPLVDIEYIEQAYNHVQKLRGIMPKV